MCLLVIIGLIEQGSKEIVAIEDGFRGSTASWLELLTNSRECGFIISPKLARDDGALECDEKVVSTSGAVCIKRPMY